MRALLSVYDKTGLVHLAEELAGMLGGRVKTLHPAVHGGILADRSKPEHLADLEAQGIVPIDLVVCNLYPFTSDPSVEMIDIGGPTMVRAAAKNHAHVGIVVDPADYEGVLAELRSAGELSAETRWRLARAAFAHTAAYDAAIVEWFDAAPESGGELLPPTLHLTLERAGELRYGENPHQRGARYRVHTRTTWWDSVVQHGGTQLSYVNLFDSEAAWRLVHELPGADEVAVVIVKHASPCGAAVASTLSDAYRLALDCDPVSAFGGIVALGGRCTEAVAAVVAEGPQADVVIARSWDPSAVEVLAARRKATRLLEAPPHTSSQTEGLQTERPRSGEDKAGGGVVPPPSRGGLGWVPARALELRSLGGGFLVQEPDRFGTGQAQWQVVTKVMPDATQWRDLELAWRVCARTSSNAIVVALAGQAVGVGAGQQSRVEAAEIAVRKAGERARDAAAASDAFFPFRDGLDVLANAGVKCIIQPGGSVRDADIVSAADEHQIAMVLTGERHFRH
ncbi:MAG: bifunctional phosphoribosylaminoimidazolecarboxamide formyltransferase/IMP cyclohydrolase [Acidimicrobiales bacterium]